MASGPKWNPARGTWYVQYWKGGKWHRKTVAYAPRPKWKPGDPEPRKIPPEAHAGVDYWTKVEKDAREHRDLGLPVSLETFLEEHVARYRVASTRAIAKLAVDPFLAWCRERGIARFDQVTRKVCQQYVDHLSAVAPGGEGPAYSIETVKTRRAYLAAAWGRLKKREEIDRNPWSKLEITGEARGKPRGAWTREQFARLLAESPEWLRPILTFGVNTGLRIGSIMRIEWRDWIKPGPGEPHFGFLDVRREIAKREGYKVPVSAELHDLLAARFGRHDHDFIMAYKDGKPLTARQQTGRAIKAAAKRAGLPEPNAPNHHLRRTFGRWAVQGHLTGTPVPLYVVSRWLGHKSVATTMIYLDLVDADSAQWMVGPASPPASPGDSRTPPPATSGPS